MTRSSSSRELGSIQCTSSKSHQHRTLLAGQAFELAGAAPRTFSPSCAGASAASGGKRPSAGNRQQLGQQRHVLRRGDVRASSAASLSSFARAASSRSNRGGAFELRDDRVERAVLVVRRAEVAQGECGSCARRSCSAASSRDLPMPGSPESSTTRPSPPFADASGAAAAPAPPHARPAACRAAPACSASNRLSTALSPSTW